MLAHSGKCLRLDRGERAVLDAPDTVGTTQDIAKLVKIETTCGASVVNVLIVGQQISSQAKLLGRDGGAISGDGA